MINNKSIRQNWKIFNKIKFMPVGFDLGLEGVESQKWSELRWEYLCDADLERLACYISKVKEFKYNITLWKDEEYLYLIQVIRTEYNTDNTLVYLMINNPENEEDIKNIAKFIHKNIKDIINHSISGVKEANKLSWMEEIDGNA